MNDQDVTIIYQGGSGGFALFYYLLLSKKFKSGYQINDTAKLIQQQFPGELRESQKNWKLNEQWPDNLACKKNSSGPRLFLICNPLFNPSVLQQNLFIAKDTFKILMHTDIHLQLRMAWDKRAYWFTTESRRVFRAPDNMQQYFRWILNQSNEAAKLEEVKQTFEPDLIIRLEDFIATQRVPGFSVPNQEQQEFLAYWLTLQSARAKLLLKRKPAEAGI